MAYGTVLNGYKLLGGTGLVLKDTHVLIAGQVGVIRSVKGGYVDDTLEEDCRYSGDPDETPSAANAVAQKGQKWASRTYNRRNRRVVRVRFVNAREEHGDYSNRAGGAHFIDCVFEDNGSQGNQDTQRETESFGGLADNVACLLRFENCKWLGNGLPSGTRQSWNSSIFGFDAAIRQYYPDGPLILNAQGKPQKGHIIRSLTDVEYINCEFVGGYWPHMASGNRSCNSTGAILLQDRERGLIKRCSFDYDKPDREVIQIRNVGDMTVERIVFRRDGDIVLNDMDNNKITIAPGIGNGDIRRRAKGDHKSTFLSKITAGYSH